LSFCFVLDNLALHNGSTASKTNKSQHQWTPAQPQVKTGGPNWQKQNLPARSTVPQTQMGWGAVSPQQGPIYRPPFGQPMGQAPMGQPMGVSVELRNKVKYLCSNALNSCKSRNKLIHHLVKNKMLV